MHATILLSSLQLFDRFAGLPEVVPGFTTAVQYKILKTGLTILALVFLRRGVLRLVDRRVESAPVRYRWSKTSSYVAFVLGVLIVAQIWLEAVSSVGTFLGLLSAGVAIALKDLVADLAGWLFIMWRRPFDLGDRIQLGEHAGDVVDIRIFAFTVLEIGGWVGADQSTGRMIHIPNANVFSQPLANYTAGFPFLWNELPVLVTFESNWKKAKEILTAVVAEEGGRTSKEAEVKLRVASKRFLIHYPTLTPVVYTSVQDSGILLTIRYLTAPRQRRGTAQAIWERILDAFAEEPDIDFAYPTQRVYFNSLEGKPGARADLPPLNRPDASS
jgi:small-conductance mechanosensitive channel